MSNYRKAGKVESDKMKATLFGVNLKYRNFVFNIIELNKDIFQHTHLLDLNRE